MSREQKAILTLIILCLSFNGCEKSYLSTDKGCECIPEANQYNLIFKYGVDSRNILNTFNCTFTKDMVMDPSLTINMTLTAQEMDTIYQKMNQIGFFSYPDTYVVEQTDIVGIISTASHYYFNYEDGVCVKELLWNDASISYDEDTTNLRELISLIINIIESKDAYKELPPPKSGYL
jgi:hypothetical protein